VKVQVIRRFALHYSSASSLRKVNSSRVMSTVDYMVNFIRLSESNHCPFWMSLADILLEPYNLSYHTTVDGLAVTTYQRKKDFILFYPLRITKDIGFLFKISKTT
jgi:hypothetical protein